MYSKSVHSGSRRRMVLPLAFVLTALAAALGAPGPGVAGGTAFMQYRQHVNRIWRSCTPRLKRIDADIARAVRAGNANRAAADFRRLLELTLAETVDIQKVSVPADARTRMRRPLRLLHGFQVQLRRVLASSRTKARLSGGLSLANLWSSTRRAAALRRSRASGLRIAAAIGA